MTQEEKHEEEIAKLRVLEQELIELIADVGSSDLMDKFLEWQDQRNKLNKAFIVALFEQIRTSRKDLIKKDRLQRR